MHPIAHYAVATTVLTSALGAFILCLLVFRYGFEPPEDEALEDRHRRFFVTRLGHAAGAVCFAITAGLAGVALGLPPASLGQGPRPAVAPAEVAALRAADTRLGETLQGVSRTVHALDERVARAAAAAQRLQSAPDEASPSVRVERPAPRRPAVAAPRPRPVMVPLASPQSLLPAPRPVTGPQPMPQAPLPTAERPVTAPVPPPRTSLPEAFAPAPRADLAPETAMPTSETPALAPQPPTTGRTVVVARETPDVVGSAVHGVARFGDALKRGFVNATRSVRRFVEDLQ